MAIEFDTGTISAANAAAVGLAMANKLRDNLVAHAAWELVEEYTPGATMKWYVFKCLAASSGLPVDYYVIVGLNQTTGRLDAFLCEGYNSTTHVASLYATNALTSGNDNSATYTYDSSGRQTSNTYTLSNTAPSAGGGVPRWINWPPSGTSTKYWTTIDDDGFTIAFNGAANGWMHFGKFDWLGSIANSCPLHYVGTSGGQYHSMTRHPAAASLTYGAWATSLTTDPGSTGSTPNNLLGFAGRLDKNDKLNNDLRTVCELGIVHDPSTQADPHVNSREKLGWVVGKVRRMRFGTNPPAGVAFGDAYAHNGTLWVPYLPTDGRIWDTGVAV